LARIRLKNLEQRRTGDQRTRVTRRPLEFLQLAGSRRRYFNSHTCINANSNKPDAMLVHATYPPSLRCKGSCMPLHLMV